MIRKTLRRLLKHRHFWREIGFDELSEIYVSMMFRGLSISLTNLFVPLYMLKLGYPVSDIISLILWYFVGRALIFDLLAGWLTARIGPKHTIICSYFMLIGSTAQFLTLPDLHWPLWLLGGLWGGTSSLFCIPFAVDFSKIKHKAHGGKELAYASIVEKASAIIGPIISGVVGGLFGGQYIFLVAIVLLLLGGLPLLRTPEPIRLQRPLNLSGLNLRRMRRDILSFAGYGIELTICGSLWPLYLGLFVFAGGTAYASLGLLASVSVVISMAAAYSIGKLVDRHRGRRLLRLGAVGNAALHCFRSFVATYPMALMLNIMNEGMTVCYKLPYTKGFYDAGDDLPGRRIAYFAFMELTSSLAKAAAWFALLVASLLISNRAVMSFGFIVAAISSLLITSESFRALKPRSHQ